MGSSFGVSGRLRNTRAVVPIRLSVDERDQISAAAERRGLTLSGFIREAALQASVVVENKVWVTDADPEPAPDRPLLVLEHVVEREHIVDGERI